ncbi:hypothetical protein [Muricoccus aerilatus]|nr:hypothetical protein [Roseomonas aerilata]
MNRPTPSRRGLLLAVTAVAVSGHRAAAQDGNWPDRLVGGILP